MKLLDMRDAVAQMVGTDTSAFPWFPVAAEPLKGSGGAGKAV